MTRESIAEAYGILHEMLEGLKIAGLRIQHLSTKLEILGSVIKHGSLSAGQYLNIFDFMSEALNDVVETNYIALHNRNLERLPVTHEGAAGSGRRTAGRRSERFLRSIIASTYSIQELDLFLRRIGESLRRMTETLSDEACGVVLGLQSDAADLLPPRPSRRTGGSARARLQGIFAQTAVLVGAAGARRASWSPPSSSTSRAPSTIRISSGTRGSASPGR